MTGESVVLVPALDADVGREKGQTLPQLAWGFASTPWARILVASHQQHCRTLSKIRNVFDDWRTLTCVRYEC